MIAIVVAVIVGLVILTRAQPGGVLEMIGGTLALSACLALPVCAALGSL